MIMAGLWALALACYLTGMFLAARAGAQREFGLTDAGVLLCVPLQRGVGAAQESRMDFADNPVTRGPERRDPPMRWSGGDGAGRQGDGDADRGG